MQVGPGVQFLTQTHPVEAEARRAKWEAAKPISVGDNVLAGRRGDRRSRGRHRREHGGRAGAVVVRDPPANMVAVGNPARVLRSL